MPNRNSIKKPRIAFLHRYGLEGWICCGGHAVPDIISNLGTDHEVHFFGPRSSEQPNPALREGLVLHELPYIWDRSNPKDKVSKTLIWYFWLPLIALRCRLMGVKLIWNDETVPFTASILQIWFGRRIAITVMDFFARIYTEKHPALRGVCRLVEAIDFAAWRKTPVLFTKVLFTQEFLKTKGVGAEQLFLYRNPVDHTIFTPLPPEQRVATRHDLGIGDDDVVLSHHGILHPNKGNDWILEQLAALLPDNPNLKFLLIGNGPEKSALEHTAKRLGVSDHVIFTGWLNSEAELNRTLNAADIGLVMRIGQETDHFHMTDTLAHEMAIGKPILAVNLKGIAEVIEDGETGFLFSPKSPTEFSERLLGLAQDPLKREQFGSAALALSKELCHVDRCADEAVKNLRQLTTPYHAETPA